MAASLRQASHVALLILAMAVGGGAAGSDGCYQPNATGFPIPIVQSNSGLCPPGWYCPNSFLNNTATWPVVCPPSPACVQSRLDYTPCPPQGEYEPQPCLEGWYCPSSYAKYLCPSGSYCPAWSTAPRACSGLSYCPSGSHTNYFVGVVLVVFLVDAAVILAYLGLRQHSSRPSEMAPAANEPDDVAEAVRTVAELIRDAIGVSAPAVNVTFDNLTVRLSEKHHTAPGKTLLRDVSGSLRAGEVTAIMGPSGAGKTVLLSTVLGKRPTEWNVEETPRLGPTLKDSPGSVGYVPQDDVLWSELTVAENVRYASEVRLPSTWDGEKKLKLRSAVLRALHIDHVRDVPIGDHETRGVSGGQRKRCSLAVELVGAPAALFLDEPTTGLDATSSLEIVRLLKGVARAAAVPVVMVIHQPRVEIWNELDSVLLLASGGRMVYSGPRDAVLQHFTEVLGEDLAARKGNPADVALDVIRQHGPRLADAWSTHARPAGVTTTPVANELPHRNMAHPLKQLALAHARAVIVHSRRPQLVLFDVLLGIIGGTLLTVAAIDGAFTSFYAGAFIALSPRASIQTLTMLMMLWGIALAGALGPAGVRALGMRRAQYWREAASGYSRWAYYIGTSSVEVYRVVLTMLHFCAVVYLMWQPYMQFGTLFGLLLLFGIALDSQSLALGNILPPHLAPLLATIIGVFTALFNGYAGIPGSNGFYAFAITELGYTYETAMVRQGYSVEPLNQWGYTLSNYAVDYGTVIAWIVGLRVLGYLLMIFLNRDKQR